MAIRKILTTKDLTGVARDVIPFVDDLAVRTHNMTLKAYLDSLDIEREKNVLFVGAFANETALLTAYPNGANYTVGTYAIVADTDTMYVYDTDDKVWKGTLSTIHSIIEINGLTGTNGIVTITGEDINSTVASATTPTQSISDHLETLTSDLIDVDTREAGHYSALTTELAGMKHVACKQTAIPQLSSGNYVITIPDGADCVIIGDLKPTTYSNDTSNAYPDYYVYASVNGSLQTIYNYDAYNVPVKLIDIAKKYKGFQVLYKTTNGWSFLIANYESPLNSSLELKGVHSVSETIASSGWTLNSETNKYEKTLSFPIYNDLISINAYSNSKHVDIQYYTTTGTNGVKRITIVSDTAFAGVVKILEEAYGV